ncbi:uncharacterized protein LOC127811084 [Diospyros lotus]|uniref:uncharacterized protein LOC127811084 n=1 Tax=Diospyros lotus TaxID=55363 RepID=UPI002257C515|nr:uncharacterized protein LOC127811084 [Diospyros lotus]
MGLGNHMGLGDHVGLDDHVGLGDHVGLDDHMGLGDHVGLDDHVGLADHVALGEADDLVEQLRSENVLLNFSNDSMLLRFEEDNDSLLLKFEEDAGDEQRRVVDPAIVLKESQRVVSMSYRISSTRAPSISYAEPPLAQKITDEPVTQKTAQSTVTSVYQTHIAGHWRNITVLWCKNPVSHSVTISVDSVHGDFHGSCRIDLKPWQFWCKKGFKTFDVDSNQVEVYWDLRSAKFCGSPEPASDFYIAVVAEEEVVLLLGDYGKKAYKRTKCRPPLVEAVMFYKKEHVFNKKCFSTRARFDPRKKEHEIVVESSTSGSKDPEMWISIDGIVLIHIRNLQWKFRGNETVQVNKLPVQVYWDVHNWLFSTPGSGHGLFIFKPGPMETESDVDENSRCGDSDDCSSSNSRYYSTQSQSKESEFCLFLYAWKLE